MTRHPLRRREALGLIGALLAAAGAPARALPPPPPPPPPSPQPARGREIRGVWLTSNDMGTLRDRARLGEALGQLERLHFNSLYPVVWNGGYAYYPSAVTERRKIQSFTFRGLQGQDLLADLIQQGHGRGLRVIPWFEFGFMAPPTSELARLHPGWLSRKRDGGTTSISAAGEVVWLNPLLPEVQAFITELVLEIITNYDADGIQFDDHMSLPSAFGYDAWTVAQYRKDTKKDPPADSADPAWVKWRADRITAFMEQLRAAIRSRRPGAIVSVSPNYHDFAYKLQLQDWLTWVRKGIVDEIVMQVYRPDLESFNAQLERPEVQETRRRIPTAVGIMTGQRNRPVAMELVGSHVLAARERGLGMVFFYFETLWERAGEPAAERQAAFAALFPTAMPMGRGS
ncbi:family 10 glycosylhydrolase [Synechococcus sp. CCY 9618]|uniref:family 10 glycosylhydrolase n=1 Tax=Synechococcus sp. CCY 9618 TaxID=2815602 RepID=UPI00352BEA95